MMQKAALLLGAGASIVAAHPAKFWLDDHHHHHYYSKSGSGSSSLAGPTSFSGSPTGSGYPLPTSISPTGGSFPTGGAFPSGGFSSYSASVPVLSSSAVAPVGYSSYSSSAAPISTSVAAINDSHKSSTTKSTKSKSTKTSSTEAATTSVAASTASADSSSGSLTSSASSGVTSVTASSGCTFTDADSAASGKKDCTSIVLSGIAVPAGETLDMTDLADGTTVTFEGTTTFGYSEWDGPLISFSGSGITIQGADGHLINMGGEQWWDGKGSNGGKTKPKGFYAHSLTDSVIKDLSIKNTPIQCFSVNGASNLQIIDVTIDDSEGDGSDGGHNTDAFDIGSSTGVYISGANVKNQDDCVAINSGTDISFTGGTCSGGHGLSIGSVGGRSDNDVANVVFSDSTVSNSANGARIKTVSGATGSVKNITYSGITLSSITSYGIVIEQDYENGSPTGTPTDGVPITDVTLSDITGSVSSGAAPYYILCASCSDWTVTGVSVTGGSASSKCKGEPSGVTLC